MEVARGSFAARGFQATLSKRNGPGTDSEATLSKRNRPASLILSVSELEKFIPRVWPAGAPRSRCSPPSVHAARCRRAAANALLQPATR